MESQACISSPVQKHIEFKTSSISKLISKSLPNETKPAKSSSKKNHKIEPFPALIREERELIQNLLQQESKRLRRKLQKSERDVSHLHDAHKLDSNSPDKYNSDGFLSTRNTSNLPKDIDQIINTAYSAHFLPQIKSPSNRFRILENSLSKESLNQASSKLIGELDDIDPKQHALGLSLAKSLENYDGAAIIGTTGRQDVVNLASWYEFMKNKYLDKLRQNLKIRIDEKDEKIKECKAILIVGMKEMIRQVGVQCTERGELLKNMMASYAEIWDCTIERYKAELREQQEDFLNEINALKFEAEKNVSQIQMKYDIVLAEKKVLERNEEKYLKKIQDLQRILETRGLEANFIPQISVTGSPNTDRNAPGRRIQSLVLQSRGSPVGSRESSAGCSDKSNKGITRLEAPINPFALETSYDSNTSRKTPVSQRKRSVTSFGDEDQITFSESPREDSMPYKVFYKKLKRKPKRLLLKLAKLTKDHILKSLNVIYYRANDEIQNSDLPTEFNYLLYNQFSKGEDVATFEEKLSIFLATCVRHNECHRITTFLRLVGMGEFIEKKNYSSHSFKVFLKAFDFMKKSDIGKMPQNQEASVTQLYPTARCIGCIVAIMSEFVQQEKLAEIEKVLKQSSIQDPKHINPEGLVDVEIMYSYILDEFEAIRWNIFNMVNFLHQTITVKDDRFFLTKEEVKILVSSVNPNKFQLIHNEGEDTQILKHLIVKLPREEEVIPLDKFIDLAIECLMLTESSIDEFLGDTKDFEDENVEDYIFSDYATISETVQNDDSIWADRIVRHVENHKGLNNKASLTWWKIIKKEFLQYL
ncbi:unnamed protein product [Blepharisma stoltei]|uniref:Uncharacterized protein n=1 Tax=Blepharisma stoltei TaxID=1481888 RepID=A0AAU9J1R6_9CILI|nr:unnamed protein product [Blepharisma stoltei]